MQVRANDRSRVDRKRVYLFPNVFRKDFGSYVFFALNVIGCVFPQRGNESLESQIRVRGTGATVFPFTKLRSVMLINGTV